MLQLGVFQVSRGKTCNPWSRNIFASSVSVGVGAGERRILPGHDTEFLLGNHLRRFEQNKESEHRDQERVHAKEPQAEKSDEIGKLVDAHAVIRVNDQTGQDEK